MEHLLKKKEPYTFDDLVEVVSILRGENGCPWDREQTNESIKMDTIEEAYEVLEAINNKDMDNLKEELGDLLLHVVFHSNIAESEHVFKLNEVTDGIVTKLIRRHPHVFGKVDVDSAEEVTVNWEAIKKEEKNHQTVTDTIISVPKALPSLVRAYKVQKKAAKVGFDFQGVGEAMKKVDEELLEFKEAVEQENRKHIEDEFGDILFSIVNIARFFKLNPENCLTNATEKFINRFKGIEELAVSKGLDLELLNITELDELWEEVKNSQ